MSVSKATNTVRLRLPNGKEADVPFANVSDADQAYLRQWTPPATTGAKSSTTPGASPKTTPAPAATPNLTLPKSNLFPSKTPVSTTPLGAPGETITLEFPDLPKDKQDLVAACKIRLPTQYDPTKPMPLLLWFSPGQGSNDPKGGLPLVDGATWAVAAMPYPTNATLPQFALGDGKMNVIRNYHMTMLKKLIESVPNVDPKLRFAGGFSNGAHCVGTYLADGDKEFIDYFRGFIIIEGGCTRKDAKKPLRNDFAYVAWGDSPGNTEGFMAGMKSAVKAGHLQVTSRTMNGVGHGFPTAEQSEVKAWIENVAMPGILAAKP
ncbi:MAG: hypothetical protein P4L99_15670 [Chthoniobacter sp.]|nr:hypothetical protein [Chthoniobacter sp.]